MLAAEILVKALEKEGVDTIYGVPGEENLVLLEAIRKSKINLILTRHEQTAGFMAATYGRLTGRAGVCLSTLGPGATNFITAAAYAQLGAFPMLMITGQKPIKSSKQGHFQILDIIDIMRPVTKYTKQISDVRLTASLVREAFRIAESERPGAVHLELPEDIADENLEGSIHIFSRSENALPKADDILLDSAALKIINSELPLILIGAGANRLDISQALSDFVHKTGLFFFSTQMGKGVVSEDSEQYLGTAALSDLDYIHCAVERSDLVINIGHDVVEKPPFFMQANKNQTVIHINFSPAQVDSIYFPQLEIIGNICDSIQRLQNKLLTNNNFKVKLENKNFSYFKKVKKHSEQLFLNQVNNKNFPLKPQQIVFDVREALSKNSIIALDNGMYKIWFARNYKAYYPNTVLLDNALATMGAGLPSAMEVARYYPDKTVVSICGDGGFMMNSQELETAVRLNLNLVILILRDDGYGMISWKQSSLGFPDYGLKYKNPDFIKYAESYGINGYRVNNSGEFLPLLKNCVQQKGLHIIDVPVDYSENTKVFIDELRTKSCVL